MTKALSFREVINVQMKGRFCRFVRPISLFLLLNGATFEKSRNFREILDESYMKIMHATTLNIIVRELLINSSFFGQLVLDLF